MDVCVHSGWPEARTRAELSGDRLALLAKSDVLAEIEATLARQRSGRIRRLGAWLRFNSKKGEKELQDVLHELRDARRLELESPERYVDIGQEEDAPSGPGGAPLPEFDIGIKTFDEKTERSIEVKNYRAKELWRAEQLTGTLDAVLEKLTKRSDSGLPLQGRTEALIHCDIPFGTRERKGAVREIAHDGTVTQRRPDGTFIGSRNLFDDISKVLPGRSGHELLDRVTLVCKDGTTIDFIRQGNQWKVR
jgi:hypothetical protein